MNNFSSTSNRSTLQRESISPVYSQNENLSGKVLTELYTMNKVQEMLNNTEASSLLYYTEDPSIKNGIYNNGSLADFLVHRASADEREQLLLLYPPKCRDFLITLLIEDINKELKRIEEHKGISVITHLVNTYNILNEFLKYFKNSENDKPIQETPWYSSAIAMNNDLLSSNRVTNLFQCREDNSLLVSIKNCLKEQSPPLVQRSASVLISELKENNLTQDSPWYSPAITISNDLLSSNKVSNLFQQKEILVSSENYLQEQSLPLVQRSANVLISGLKENNLTQASPFSIGAYDPFVSLNPLRSTRSDMLDRAAIQKGLEWRQYPSILPAPVDTENHQARPHGDISDVTTIIDTDKLFQAVCKLNRVSQDDIKKAIDRSLTTHVASSEYIKALPYITNIRFIASEVLQDPSDSNFIAHQILNFLQALRTDSIKEHEITQFLTEGEAEICTAIYSLYNSSEIHGYTIEELCEFLAQALEDIKENKVFNKPEQNVFNKKVIQAMETCSTNYSKTDELIEIINLITATKDSVAEVSQGLGAFLLRAIAVNSNISGIKNNQIQKPLFSVLTTAENTSTVSIEAFSAMKEILISKIKAKPMEAFMPFGIQVNILSNDPSERLLSPRIDIIENIAHVENTPSKIHGDTEECVNINAKVSSKDDISKDDNGELFQAVRKLNTPVSKEDISKDDNGYNSDIDIIENIAHVENTPSKIHGDTEECVDINAKVSSKDDISKDDNGELFQAVRKLNLDASIFQEDVENAIESDLRHCAVSNIDTTSPEYIKALPYTTNLRLMIDEVLTFQNPDSDFTASKLLAFQQALKTDNIQEHEITQFLTKKEAKICTAVYSLCKKQEISKDSIEKLRILIKDNEAEELEEDISKDDNGELFQAVRKLNTPVSKDDISKDDNGYNGDIIENVAHVENTPSKIHGDTEECVDINAKKTLAKKTMANFSHYRSTM